MFRRRKPLTFSQNLRQVLWPKMGWWRMAKYYRYRILRLSSSAESIAFNMAAGSAMSFTPFFGIHIFGAMGLAWLIGLRMNLIAATVGTFFGNPWTFPFIWWGTLRLGEVILGSSRATDIPERINLHYIFDHPWAVLLPMTIGGLLVSGAVWTIVYFSSSYFVEKYQRIRAERLRRRREAGAAVTGPGSGEGLVP